MNSRSYEDPRLVAVYDPLNPKNPGDPFYLALAGTIPKRILDMGCGTGRLACELATHGHHVTGADPASAMLEVAAHRPNSDKVTWLNADAQSLSVAEHFDLVIMTGHAFQTLLRDQDVRAALRNLHRLLAPRGLLAFETRNPLVREWDTWRPECGHEVVAVPGVGNVTVHYDIRSEDSRQVTFETHFRFGEGDVVVVPNTLRLMQQGELAGFLREAGFDDVGWYGAWDGSPFHAASAEIIAVARNSG